MKVFVVNDTRRYHFGSKMVMETIDRELQARGVDIIGYSPSHEHWEKYKDVMAKADLVLVNGEGSIHHSYRTELLTVANYFPSVLVNFSFYKYDEAFNGKVAEGASNFKMVVARESLSAAEWFRKTNGQVIDVVPDFSMAVTPKTFAVHLNYRVGIFDSVDVDLWYKKSYDMISPFKPNFVEYANSYPVWVTGRFHGIALAMMLNKPFTAYKSNTHKNAGIMGDAGIGHLYFGDNINAAVDHALTLSAPEEAATHYITKAQRKIPQLFDRIVAL